MTTIPATYDFFTRFKPLPIHNQGDKDICWDEQWANHLRAFGLMYDHTTYAINPNALTSEPLGAGQPGYRFTTVLPNRGAKQFVSAPVEDYVITTPDQIRRALWLNGVIQAAVPSRAPAYENAWSDKNLPVLKPRNDHADLDHSNLVVGYTADGVITLNSWGLQWGHQGRAVLSWDFITHYGVSFEVDTYGSHPVDGLTA